MYLLRLAFRPWRLAPMSQIFSAAAVGFLLLVATLLFWLQLGISPVISRLQGEQVITAYLDTSVREEDENKVVDQIKISLGAQANPEVQLVSAPKFIQQLKKPYPELSRDLDNLGADMYQVIPRYISISGILPEWALQTIKKISGVENAESSKDRYRQIVSVFLVLRWVARILMVGILLALLTGLIHLSRTNAYLHRDSLSILKFLGGGSVVLLAPGIFSALLVGLMGGTFASGSWITFGVWLANHIRGLSPFLKNMPPAHAQMGVFLFCFGALSGAVSGLFGTWLASQGRHQTGSGS